jgi:hypothetical protein
MLRHCDIERVMLQWDESTIRIRPLQAEFLISE